MSTAQVPAIPASLRFRHGLEACLYFALTPPEGVDGTSAVFLSADVSGCKMEESKTSTMRPYFLVVLEGYHGRLIIVGKLMETLVTSYYRGAIFPAREFIVRSDATDACAFHLVRAHAPVGESPLHYVLRTKTPAARGVLEDALLTAMLLSDSARKPEPSKMRAFAVRKAQNSVAVGGSAAAAASADAAGAASGDAATASRDSVVVHDGGSGHASRASSQEDDPVEKARRRLTLLERDYLARYTKGAFASTTSSSGDAEWRGGRLNVEALPAMPPRSDEFAPGGPEARHRYMVYSELLQTEKAHISSLQIVAVQIMGALLPQQATPPEGGSARLPVASIGRQVVVTLRVVSIL
jgi:hypothetical protein